MAQPTLSIFYHHIAPVFPLRLRLVWPVAITKGKKGALILT